MNRQAMLERIQTRTHPWDMVIVGGGATGVGVALDAACRGYDVALFEQADFGKGTSSRSTKLVHGGLRYLQQGNLALVREALRERSLLRNNAPQLVKDLSFVVPTYRWWEGLYYGLGLQAYNLLGRGQFGRSRRLSRQQTLACLPTLQSENLRGGILYHDGLFDDARFLIQLARTAADHGATLINHAPVVGLLETRTGMGLVVRDEETGEELPIPARTVVNATGPFSDAFRRLCDPKAKPFLVHSQGVHLVLPWEFLEGECALLIPRTRDGRLLFVIPWLGHVLVGTTDLPLEQVPLEPRATEEEIDFLLSTVAAYLKKQPTRAEVLSVFAGIRALIAPPRSRRTAQISREHAITIDRNVFTIAGGKWTTYRQMAQDCVDRVARWAPLPSRPCVTHRLPLHGYHPGTEEPGPWAQYGSDAPALQTLAATDPGLTQPLHPDLPYLAAEVIWAARFEMARTVEDVLARRMRMLFLNARAALAAAPRVANLLAGELGRDASWQEEQVRSFTELGRGYLAGGLG